MWQLYLVLVTTYLLILSISSGGKFEVAMSEVMNWLNQIGAWQWIFNFLSRRPNTPLYRCKLHRRAAPGLVFYKLHFLRFLPLTSAIRSLTKTRGPQQGISKRAHSIWSIWYMGLHDFSFFLSFFFQFSANLVTPFGIPNLFCKSKKSDLWSSLWKAAFRKQPVSCKIAQWSTKDFWTC